MGKRRGESRVERREGEKERDREKKTGQSSKGVRDLVGDSDTQIALFCEPSMCCGDHMGSDDHTGSGMSLGGSDPNFAEPIGSPQERRSRG